MDIVYWKRILDRRCLLITIGEFSARGGFSFFLSNKYIMERAEAVCWKRRLAVYI